MDAPAGRRAAASARDARAGTDKGSEGGGDEHSPDRRTADDLREGRRVIVSGDRGFTDAINTVLRTFDREHLSAGEY
jgi:hypothetical protein